MNKATILALFLGLVAPVKISNQQLGTAQLVTGSSSTNMDDVKLQKTGLICASCNMEQLEMFSGTASWYYDYKFGIKDRDGKTAEEQFEWLNRNEIEYIPIASSPWIWYSYKENGGCKLMDDIY